MNNKNIHKNLLNFSEKDIERIKKIEGVDVFIKSRYEMIVNEIDDFIRENWREDKIKIPLCEMGDDDLELILFSLKKLEKEGILKGNYEFVQEKELFVDSHKQNKKTEAELKYDSVDIAIEKQIAIENYNDSPYNIPTTIDYIIYFIIDKKNIDTKKLIEKVTNKKSIKEMELLLEGNKLKIYINKEVAPIKLYDSSKANSIWRVICKLAEQKIVAYNRNIIKYINSNKKNPIYSTGVYKTTKILEKCDKGMKANIPIAMVSELTINKRTGQKNKK